MLAAASLSAQTITLQFTARDATDNYVQLDSVIITNFTRNWQETVFWPDNNLAYIAKSLASKEHWGTFSGNCVPGNNQNDNNATVFSAVPAGCGQTTSFSSSGFETIFWTSTSSTGAFANSYSIAAILATVSSSNSNKKYGRSVRCIRD